MASQPTCRATLSGHGHWMRAAAFSPDGKTVVTGSDDKTAKLWDAASGKCRATLSGHSWAVLAAAFSPDGRTVVTGSWDETAKLWDAASGKCRATLSGHSDGVHAAAFSPDGKMVVTGSYDKTAKLWDAASGACRATLSGHSHAVLVAAFSPDGKTVVTCNCDMSAKLWDAANGKCRATLSGHISFIIAAAFSPDGKMVVTGSEDNTAKLWDAASGACRATLSGHSGIVCVAAFSPNGKTVVTGSSIDNTAKLWDAASGACRATLSGHSRGLHAVAFSPDGKTVVTGSDDKTAKLWDAASGKCSATLSGHSGDVNAAAFSPDGKTVVTGSNDKTAKLWDTSFYAPTPAPDAEGAAIAAAQRVAAAERAAAEADAARRSAEARAAALEREQAAAAAAAVPADIAAWLSTLQLSDHGLRLVSDHKLAFVSDCRFLEEGDLTASGLAKVEARRFLAAAAKLGGESKRLGGVAAAAEAQQHAGGHARVRALVIGIDAYSSPVPGRLDNAVADARAVHEALSKLSGAASTLLTDCTKAAFEQALTDFRDGTGVCKGRGMRVDAAPAAAAEQRTLGVVFFAGHGLQVSGRNFLVPADFKVPARNDKLEVMLKDTARACIGLDAVEETLEDAGVFAGSVLLDCCRNVPDFLAELGAKRSVGGGTRALPAGMGDAKPSLADLMVTFATAPGTEALDRSSRVAGHSPFTAALLKALTAPRRLLELNPFLTDEVAADSGGKQRPHVGGSYGTEAGNLMLG